MTAALVAILQFVTELLSCNLHVVVITLDFSKAFDTVSHSTLLHKMASMNIPDDVYSWLVDFFSGHSHCTRFRGSTSRQLDISASIMQGSAIGPASYVVNAADLTTVTAGNLMFNYADDTYIVIPAANTNSRLAERDQLNVGSCKQCHTIARGLWFPGAENLAKIQLGSRQTEAPNAGGAG